jgi:threonine/homoserine/homoserine lactone efflux protein
MELVLIFLKGIAIGLVGSIPLGPIGVLVIQRTLGKGRLSGFFSGLGAATADTMLALVASLGLSMILDFISHYETQFQIVGGVVLIIVGYQIFFKNPIKQVRERKLQKNNLTSDFFSVVFLTFTNPVAVFLFIALFASLNVFNGASGYVLHCLIVAGVFVGSVLYWFLLSTFVNLYRHKFRLRRMWWLNKITGMLIFLFGLFALIRVLVLFLLNKFE